MFLLSFENLEIEGDSEVDDDELAQITNKLFVPDRIVTLAAEKTSPEKSATQDYNDTDDYGHTIKKDQKHLEIVVLVVLVFFEGEK